MLEGKITQVILVNTKIHDTNAFGMEPKQPFEKDDNGLSELPLTGLPEQLRNLIS